MVYCIWGEYLVLVMGIELEISTFPQRTKIFFHLDYVKLQ